MIYHRFPVIFEFDAREGSESRAPSFTDVLALFSCTAVICSRDERTPVDNSRDL